MSNPYQSPQFSPQSPFAGAPGVDREKLRRVAKYQQWVIYTLLTNIIIYVLVLVARGAGFEAVSSLISLLFLPTALFGMVAIFLLAKELYNIAIGVLCALLMILPCISLLTLVIVNQGATGFLTRHAVKVGFMGANPNQI